MLGSIFSKIKNIPKKFVLIGVILIAILVYFSFRPQAANKYDFATVKKQNISAAVSASGVLAGKNTVNLSFLQGGRLAFINVKTNDRVNAGQTIAGLDAQALNIQLQQAENTLREKQATVEKTLDDIHLFQYGNGGFANVGTPNETQTQKQLRTTAEVARDNAFDNIKITQRNLQDLYISAPFAGIVTQRNVFPGQFVSSANLIVQVVDDSEIFFDTDVDQADISKVSLDQEVEVNLDAYPNQVLKGKVSEILSQTKTTATGAVVVTVRVLLTPSIKFIAGLQGQASIVTERNENVLTIPIEAIKSDGTVLIKTAKGVQPVKVKTGTQSDTDVQIMEGLEEGQEIVINPS